MPRLKKLLLASLAAAVVSACGDRGDERETDPPVGKAPAGGGDKSSSGGAGRGGALADFAGGRVKAVWVQQQKSGQLDRHGNGKSLKLMALDTADGRGERPLIDEVGGNTRPLIAPDGERVVFSQKGFSKRGSTRRYRPRCFVVNFDGSGRKELGEGYAECLWMDPESGEVWVYVGADYKESDNSIMEGRRLERFPLGKPSQREVVWKKTGIGSEAFGLSRDGALMVGLFPWPDAGVIDTAGGQLARIGNGCWTAIAPDNSGVTWVLDGGHRQLTFRDRAGAEIGVVELGVHPELRGRRIYHPRWVHPRFAAMTGPYLADSKKGADSVEIYLAKFSADLRSVEATRRLTDNDRADLYPDLWIEGASSAELGAIAAAQPQLEPAAADGGGWPAAADGLVFAWMNARENVEVGGEISRVWAEGAARFGRRFDMAPGEGSFTVEALAEKEFAADVPLAFEVVLTPAPDDGPVLRVGAHQLAQAAGELQLRSHSRDGVRFARFGKLVPGEAIHLACQITVDGYRVAVDGEPVSLRAGVLGFERDVETKGVRFGGGWDGRLERVAVYRGELPGAQLVASAGGADLERTPAAGRVKLRGKLLEKTEAPDLQRLGSYRRALLYYLYEVEAVLEGTLDAPRVVVAHWAILDRKPAAGLPERIGEQFELEVEPWAEHPQLKSEFREENVSDIDAPIYFDISLPRIRKDDAEPNEE